MLIRTSAIFRDYLLHQVMGRRRSNKSLAYRFLGQLSLRVRLGVLEILGRENQERVNVDSPDALGTLETPRRSHRGRRSRRSRRKATSSTYSNRMPAPIIGSEGSDKQHTRYEKALDDGLSEQHVAVLKFINPFKLFVESFVALLLGTARLAIYGLTDLLVRAVFSPLHWPICKLQTWFRNRAEETDSAGAKLGAGIMTGLGLVVKGLRFVILMVMGIVASLCELPLEIVRGIANSFLSPYNSFVKPFITACVRHPVKTAAITTLATLTVFAVVASIFLTGGASLPAALIFLKPLVSLLSPVMNALTHAAGSYLGLGAIAVKGLCAGLAVLAPMILANIVSCVRDWGWNTYAKAQHFRLRVKHTYWPELKTFMGFSPKISAELDGLDANITTQSDGDKAFDEDINSVPLRAVEKQIMDPSTTERVNTWTNLLGNGFARCEGSPSYVPAYKQGYTNPRLKNLFARIVPQDINRSADSSATDKSFTFTSL